MDYEAIKALAKARHCRVEDLIALAPKNDPFYVGTPSDIKEAEWFAALWHQFGYTQNVHVRRVHYQVISQDPPVLMPNGLPYENTEKCWDFISAASASARYLKMVDAAAFVDRRNPEPYLQIEQIEDPAIYVSSQGIEGGGALPEFPSPPDYTIWGYESAPQPYHLEIWCEKSTMNDILRPLCQSFGVQLVTGLGELSITATLKAVQRVMSANRPARIFYVSDFDPAGQAMPVSVARKIEYFIRQMDDSIDLRLFPVMLTLAQVQEYKLPTTPIKDGEKRKESFEQRYGEGAVELDALEALRPGALRQLLVQQIRHYYDATLIRRTRGVKGQLTSTAQAKRDEIIDTHADSIHALASEYDALSAEYAGRFSDISQRTADLWETIDDELRDAMPSIEDYPLPDGQLVDAEASGMFDSCRPYEEQIAAYKQHQGKDTEPKPKQRKPRKSKKAA